MKSGGVNVKDKVETDHPVFQLELEGMRIEEGTDAGADSQFLMELMEINEALDQARTSEEADKIGQDTKGKHVSLLCNRLKVWLGDKGRLLFIN